MICTKRHVLWSSKLGVALRGLRSCNSDKKATRPVLLARLTEGQRVTWQRLIGEE